MASAEPHGGVKWQSRPLTVGVCAREACASQCLLSPEVRVRDGRGPGQASPFFEGRSSACLPCLSLTAPGELSLRCICFG